MDFNINVAGLMKAATEQMMAPPDNFPSGKIQPFILRAYGSLLATSTLTTIQLTKNDTASALAGSNLLGKTDALFCVAGRQSVIKVTTGDVAGQCVHYTYPEDLVFDFTGEFKSIIGVFFNSLLTLTPNSATPVFRSLQTSFFGHVPTTQHLATQFQGSSNENGPHSEFKPFYNTFYLSGDATNQLDLVIPNVTGVGGDTSAELNYYCFEILGILLKDQAKNVIEKGLVVC